MASDQSEKGANQGYYAQTPTMTPAYQQQPQGQQQQQQPPQYQEQYQPPQFPPPPTVPITAQAQAPTHAQDSDAASAAASGKPTMRERFYQWSVKVGQPVNRITNKLGSEAFWPSSLDLECDKAARILKSFSQDGFYTTPQATDPSTPGPKGKQPKALVKIPAEAIKGAAGLAIFTTFRSGLHISGAGGSGIIVARLPDGGWSPPSGFLVHTLGAGFMIGLDIYDCVCVLRTPEAVKAFTSPRVSLGGEFGLVAGPVGAGAYVDNALTKKVKVAPVWSYMKSRGFYAGIQADGTIIVARPDANGDFYGKRGITVEQILNGQVPPPNYASATGTTTGTGGGVTLPPWPVATRNLMEVLKAAEGRKDVDNSVLHDISSGPTPGDLGLGESEHEVQLPQDKTKKV